MKYLLHLLFLQLLIVPNALADGQSSSLCKAPELVVNQNQYNDEVCSGILMMQSNKYKVAISHFEKALQMNLLEVPNFHLLPRLALAYSAISSNEKAITLLAQAELALKVYTRILECSEKNGKFSIVRRSWDKSYLVDSPYHDQVAAMMCGDAYAYIYQPDNLTVNIREAELVQNYLSVKKAVEALVESSI